MSLEKFFLPKKVEQKEEVETEEQYLLNQFHNTERLTIGGEEIEIVDITPHEVKTEVPTVVVPGFSATPEAMKDLILRTALAGRRVISAYAPHGIDIQERKADIADAQLRKLEFLIGMLEVKNLPKVNLIANSEASIYTTAAATLVPERIAQMVLIAPAGLIGKDTVTDLLTRVYKDLQVEGKANEGLEKLAYPSSLTPGIKSILSDIPASIREIQGIAGSDITDLLKKVHESGVGVSIIHGVDDQYFPMEKVQKMVKANMLDGFYSVKGSHNSIYTYEPFGRVAEMALDALEKKQSR